MEGISARSILAMRAAGAVMPSAAARDVAEVAEIADPHDVATIALGYAEASTVTADEGVLAASYAGELGEALDEMTVDAGEADDKVRDRLTSLEEQADGWIIAGWPLDVDTDTQVHHQPHMQLLPEETYEEETHEVPSFVEWLGAWH